MIVKYENSLGQVIDLNDKTYFVNQNDLRNFTWAYTVLGRPSGLGGMVRQFYRHSATKVMRVAVRGADFAAKMNALHALTEVDILARKPGKLWVDNEYLICYMAVGSEVILYREKAKFAEKSLQVLAVEPFWNSEKNYLFVPESLAGEYGKKYDLKFAYRFGTGYSNTTIYNTHYISSPMVITIAGPAENPSFSIGGNFYAVTVDIGAGERLEINQVNRTILLITGSGAKINLFNLRDKTNDIFKPCPSGAVAVAFLDLIMQITLIQQRSEPTWR